MSKFTDIESFAGKMFQHISSEVGVPLPKLKKAVKSFYQTVTVEPAADGDSSDDESGNSSEEEKPVQKNKKVAPKKKSVPKSKKPSSSKSAPAKKSSKSSAKKSSKSSAKNSSDVHTCERVPRGKDDACGKNARRSAEIDGETHWYCGTDKSGCFKSIMNQLSKQNMKPASKSTSSKTSTKSSKGGTLAEKKKAADARSKSLIKKVKAKKQLNVKSIKVDGKKLWWDPETRILFDPKTQEAYGHLSKKKKIEKLNDENVRFLEASGASIKNGSVEKVDSNFDLVSSNDDSNSGEENSAASEEENSAASEEENSAASEEENSAASEEENSAASEDGSVDGSENGSVDGSEDGSEDDKSSSIDIGSDSSDGDVSGSDDEE